MPTRNFFYGVYMDAILLESMGFQPRPVVAARLDEYAIMIGERATLAPESGKSACGFFHDLSEEESENDVPTSDRIITPRSLVRVVISETRSCHRQLPSLGSSSASSL
jgi:hypothetical protein